MFVSRQGDQPREHRGAFDGELCHGVRRRPAALGGAAGVEQPRTAVLDELGHVRMAVDDDRAARERLHETRRARRIGTGVMDKSDAHPLDLDDPACGEPGAQRRVVHVPVYRLDGSHTLEVVEHRRGDEVTRVQDQIGSLEPPQALARKTPRAAREMRVRDDRDVEQVADRQRRGNCFFVFFLALRAVGFPVRSILPTRKGGLIMTLTRVGFISASRRMPYA